jgi:hypothetical protein
LLGVRGPVDGVGIGAGSIALHEEQCDGNRAGHRLAVGHHGSSAAGFLQIHTLPLQVGQNFGRGHRRTVEGVGQQHPGSGGEV